MRVRGDIDLTGMDDQEVFRAGWRFGRLDAVPTACPPELCGPLYRALPPLGIDAGKREAVVRDGTDVERIVRLIEQLGYDRPSPSG